MKSLPLALGLVLVAVPASADELFVRTGLGVGRVRSRNSEAPSVGASVSDSFAYWGSSFELTVGVQHRRWSIGGTILEHSVEVDRKTWQATPPFGGDYTFTLFSVGPSVEWHPEDRGGPWCGGTLGIAQLSNGSDEAPFGGATSLQGGWDFPVNEHSSLALGARLTYARLSSDRYLGSRQDVFSPMFVLSWVRR